MPRGYLCLILHAHLPFVRHPEYEDFFEERWFFEAVTGCYLPLLRMLRRLAAEGVPFRLALSLSPTLLAMLGDDLLRRRYRRHLERLRTLAAREVERTRGDPAVHPLARFHDDLFRELDAFHGEIGGDLVAAFRALADAGRIELWTTAATHGYLPLLRIHPPSVRAQIRVGAEAFRRAVGHDAGGFWLPECAYHPGVEPELAAAGFRWFVVDSHGLLNGSPRPRHGLYAPVACPGGLAAFGRDTETSRQVWSATEGYPGDPRYREFHRDIGHELPLEHLAPCLLDGRTRVHTGIKYRRITGPTEDKQWYDPEAARQAALGHARHFVESRRKQVAELAARMDRPPVVVSPYDAELFGHWWFEGPVFLEAVIREAARDSDLELVTPGVYLARHSDLQASTPAASSWGWEGFHGAWLNEDTERIWPPLHHGARRMGELAARYGAEPRGSRRERVLAQAARSLLLAQASDWPFLIKNGAAAEYAGRRLRDHLARFDYVASSIEGRGPDDRHLAALEQLEGIFPWLDFRVFA